MSRLGKKLRANGWSRCLPGYGYKVYKKNDMKITYCDDDYYCLSNVDGRIIAVSKYLLKDSNLTIPKKHKFFEMFIKARNFVHAKSIMDNYLLKAMIDKTL